MKDVVYERQKGLQGGRSSLRHLYQDYRELDFVCGRLLPPPSGYQLADLRPGAAPGRRHISRNYCHLLPYLQVEQMETAS